ncbi:MAG: 50S ribosomal protein L20 [Candidatus Pacebacteria bacterium]|nr:50S ribosomal protein L20 [Candidatus Paceibacterota bacterium]PIR63311.1 MAG: 50S ribosomal protein L20 [Candidatus Pacebacteria bacterium CG10_big_fil_rev_8_21_14_0_10_40_26]PIZ79043.1 MAG: 50S ribosomal protein L20 [Candidatus Pacebacteria bacterium CG_4_10_14_0_2_um_filter_40_20]PJA68511.1 MAG: 50S ribosomal protein L20 [Candidatus Pacebacteria bacterium CG_4_9_14_3_um_filter_40_12]PJC41895.1 MAG: 50S ribosomal protein L20 [Candidatus Pacebacteria bacterium CG_4_9_14_0_2_um_filter_40_15]
MPRVKTGVTRHRRHKKVLKLTKGFRGTNNRLYKRASEALLHAGQYAYIGRKLRKRDMRKLWILRVSAAVKEADETLNYSRFMNLLKKADIQLNRKMLSELAIADFSAFKSLVSKVRG